MNITLAFILLMLNIILFQYTNIDIAVQDLFYNAQNSSWAIDEQNKLLSLIFYSGLKKAIVLFGIGILVSLIFFKNQPKIKKYKSGLTIVLLSLIIVPSIIGALKATTNMPCPNNEMRYGGIYPKVKLWESYPDAFKPPSKSKCYPAGHASGGFALLSLYFLFKNPRNKKIALLIALTLGWAMGLYKIMVGDHFLGHTTTTMLLAWLLVLIIAKATYHYTKGSNETHITE